MIPYDDLVVALQSWRAKQGLPVAGLVAAPAPGSGRTAVPPPAPAPSEPAPQVYAVDEALEVDEALVEEHDYGAVEHHGDDETAIGVAPQRSDYDENPTELASESGHLRNQREDW